MRTPGGGSPITAGTSSPSRSPSPTRPGRSSAPSLPPENWRPRRRSTSARSISRSPHASVPGFAEGLATRLGVPAERVASSPDGVAGAHTAAPAFALESAASQTARTTLFVSAGAGISVARGYGLTERERPRSARTSPGCKRCSRPMRAAPLRIAPARPRSLRPLARVVAEIAGRLTPAGPPNIFTTLGQHPRLFPRLAALLRAPDAVRSAAEDRHRAGDPAGRVARGARPTSGTSTCRSPSAWALRPARSRRGRFSSRPWLHEAPAGAARRQRRAARPAPALRRDVGGC